MALTKYTAYRGTELPKACECPSRCLVAPRQIYALPPAPQPRGTRQAKNGPFSANAPYLSINKTRRPAMALASNAHSAAGLGSGRTHQCPRNSTNLAVVAD